MPDGPDASAGPDPAGNQQTLKVAGLDPRPDPRGLRRAGGSRPGGRAGHPKQPPDPIQEMPPDQKPAGQNVQWIPGYWSWDVTRNDYLWVSGIWREPPPNSQWVPGYWHQVEGGTSGSPGRGFRSVRATQAQAQGSQSYLPPPPASLETGPEPRRSRRPERGLDARVLVLAGIDYAWRPGFWAAVQPNWIWMPAHYVWTPSGYLFVARILGPAGRQPRVDVRPGLLPTAGLHAAQLCVHAVDQHRRLGRHRQPVRVGRHQSVSVR